MPLGEPSSPLFPSYHFDTIGLFEFNRWMDRLIDQSNLIERYKQ
jgi:hypothetical protein